MTIFSPYFPIFLSLSLSLFISFILSTLINLFTKNHNHHHHHHHNIHSLLGFPGGLGFIVTAVRHVIVKKPPSPPPPPPPPLSSPARKRDAGDNIGVLDDVVDGLTSCTESLGFESSEESRLDDPIIEKVENNIDEDYCCWRRKAAEGRGNWNWRKMGNHVKKEMKSFPPPLSSLNLKGQPSFFLRPVRKEGRLELTEVRIHRPEILHVRRHDGRLTLHLIPDESVLDDREEQEQEQEIAESEGEIGELEEEIAGTTTEEEEEEEEEVGFGEWKFGMGSNEGLRRCHEVVNHHRRRHVHHHHHHSHPLHACGVGIA